LIKLHIFTSQTARTGIGIQSHLTGSNMRIIGNTIDLATMNTANDGGFNQNILRGIQSMQSEGNRINCNTVNGLQSQNVFNARNSQAIGLIRAQQSEVSCNQVNNTWFGITAYGDCHTNEKNIRANMMSNHIYGLATLPGIFSDEGDLNDIGLSTQDNNNQFNGAAFNANNDRTIRWWSNQNAITNKKIYTALSFGNTSNYPGGEYQLAQTTGTPQNCLAYSGCGNDINQLAQDITNIDEGLAMDIAQDSIIYYAFPAVSQWVAQYELYSNLERDSTLRASNALLNSFYQSQQAQAIGQIRTTEQKINLLTDSTSYADSSLYASRLADAKQSNNAISGTENYIQNTKWTNALLLKTMEYGRDSISAEEIEQLETLAKSCPSIEGLGVYKARVLYTYYEPIADYDDYATCNPQTKNGKSMFGDFMNFITNPSSIETKEVAQGIQAFESYKLYPVPTNDNLTIEYDFVGDEDANMYIYDILGREMAIIHLRNTNTKVSFSVLNLPNGIYTYKIKVGKETKTGKIQILK
jgi:hypothetical protein